MLRPSVTPFVYYDVGDYVMDSDNMDNDDTSHTGSADENSGSSSQQAATGAPNDKVQNDLDNDAQPIPKKPKTTESDVALTFLTSDIFSTLSFDLLHEVLGYLYPLDLLHLARTSKALRSYLMSKRSSNAWKNAREAVAPAVPQCPKDQSEPQWAALLFTQDCTTCGKSQSSKVEWTLRLRGCQPCFQKNEEVAIAFPDIEDMDTVLELIPHARTDGYIYSKNFCFSAHVKGMAKIVKDYKTRIDSGIEGAQNEFDKFVEREKAEVAEQVESGNKLKRWAQEVAGMRRQMEEELIKERKEAMTARLIELGHDLQDVDVAAHHDARAVDVFFNIRRRLSDAEWERIKPKVEAVVQRWQRFRIESERKKVFESRYDDFQKTYDASPDELLPDSCTVLRWPSIAQFIKANGDDIEPTVFDEAFHILPSLIDQWRRVTRIDLARMILEAQGGSGSAGEDPETAEKAGILHLATSIFVSCAGLKGVRTHSPTVHWVETINKLECICFSDRSGTRKTLKGVKAQDEIELGCILAVPDWIAQAKEVVQAAGLDPGTATAKDMDNINLRFWCNECTGVKWNGNVARNWRNCIAHIGFHKTPSTWAALSASDRAIIEAKETALATIHEIDWDKMAVSLQGVVVNVYGSRIKLKIPPSPSSAQEGNLDAAANVGATGDKVKCKMCPKSTREFKLSALANHARGKHGVTDFRAEDFIRV
ncbi:hypothetical protein FRC01_005208 [Tulasnella sp. 417]|nr:hypothetical protein FRC01_005208 [Tulasnella sp. 417]